jgi:DNA-directed RNA polymerase subunit RPC12/RpoP
MGKAENSEFAPIIACLPTKYAKKMILYHIKQLDKLGVYYIQQMPDPRLGKPKFGEINEGDNIITKFLCTRCGCEFWEHRGEEPILCFNPKCEARIFVKTSNRRALPFCITCGHPVHHLECHNPECERYDPNRRFPRFKGINYSKIHSYIIELNEKEWKKKFNIPLPPKREISIEEILDLINEKYNRRREVE